MNYSGRARNAALKMIFWTLLILLAILAGGLVAKYLAALVEVMTGALIGLWLLFVLFTLYFFRDPEANVPSGPGLIVSPAHGKVDVIDEIPGPAFMGGRCRRISIFLSVIDVHVQNAPVAGKVFFYQYTTGQFLNALKTESAERNENALVGIAVSERGGEKIGVRLIAGLIARRIVPFVKEGDDVSRGGRISLIQFGSRTDLYLPLSAKIKVQLGDRVVGGETVMGSFD